MLLSSLRMRRAERRKWRSTLHEPGKADGLGASAGQTVSLDLVKRSSYLWKPHVS